MASGMSIMDLIISGQLHTAERCATRVPSDSPEISEKRADLVIFICVFIFKFNLASPSSHLDGPLYGFSGSERPPRERGLRRVRRHSSASQGHNSKLGRIRRNRRQEMVKII